MYNNYRWHAPLDSKCPRVKSYYEAVQADEPMSQAMGAPMGEINSAWEDKHRGECKRCQLFGAKNIEVAHL